MHLGQHRSMRQLLLPEAGQGIEQQWRDHDDVGEDGQEAREAPSRLGQPRPQAACGQSESPVEHIEQQKYQRIFQEAPQGVHRLQGLIWTRQVERGDLDRQPTVVSVGVDSADEVETSGGDRSDDDGLGDAAIGFEGRLRY